VASLGGLGRVGPVDRTGRDTILRPSPALPPNRAATVSGMRRGFGLEVAAIGLLVVACTAAPSERPSPSEAASLSASPAPTVAVTSTPAPTASPSPAAESLPNVHTTALGEVTGNWLFYDVQIPRPERNGVEVQIVAVPAGGGAATTVVAFDGGHKPWSLRRQFSPDGRRMVLSINGQLVVIDLVTGQAKPLGVQGLYPSWSRDGSQIAFTFNQPEPNHPGYAYPMMGVMPAAGGSPRALASAQFDGHSAEWSPDGSQILVYYPPLGPCTSSGGCIGAHVTMEVASGRIGPTQIAWVSGAHWRVGSPELAVTIQTCGQPADERIVGIDVGTGRERTLVDVTDQCTEVELRDPRWNPAVANELLYVAIGHRGTAGAATDDFEAHVVNISTGQNTRLPISAYEATWTSDGSAVAYVAKTQGSSYGSALRVWKRDGSGETELRRATGAEAFFSIASVNY